MEMYLISGRRKSDLVELKETDVNLAAGTVRVPACKRKKQGERRPITKDALRRAHETARKKADLPDFRIHDCRDTLAIRLLCATGNLKLVLKVLDHQDIKSTLKHAHVLEEEALLARAEVNVHRHSGPRRAGPTK